MKQKFVGLDLHGMTSVEAEAALDEFLFAQSQKTKGIVRIMTGKGQGVLHKVVTSYLKKAGYSWEYEKLPNGQQNAGVLLVRMS